MKTKLSIILLTLLSPVFASIMISCGKEKISFTEYSLEGTSCQWVNLNHNSDRVLIINSDEELKPFISCTDSNNYPAIDFSKHTLLIACGGTTSSLGHLKSKIYKNANRHYTLKITAVVGYFDVSEMWEFACFTAKLSGDIRVTLEYTEQHL